MAWNSDVYDKFKAERYSSIHDILPLLDIRSNLEIVDLGCGNGALTKYLIDLFPNCLALGIDSSVEMLSEAYKRETKNLKFKLSFIEEIDGNWDLVFSHSAVQWLTNHRKLIPKLCSLVKPRGQLVIQIPAMYNHPVQVMIRETASEDPFEEQLKGWVRNPDLLLLEEYGEILHDHLGEDIHVFSKVYPYILEDIDQVIEWVMGTSLIPYMEKLPCELHSLFIERYRGKLYNYWGENKVKYFFNRFFLTGKRKIF